MKEEKVMRRDLKAGYRNPYIVLPHLMSGLKKQGLEECWSP